MEYKCKICAGSLTIDQKTRIAVCDYCGTKQTLPLFGDDSSKALYERGNQYLLHNEYDKAEGIFSQLLSVNPNDAEIYWDLVLCKYGVTYAKDPQTGRYIPTCNRTHTDSVLKDENYLRALELSVGDKAELYKRDAGIIENIQKGILEVSKREKPFDVFISYKETDANGNRTKDSIEAQKLYEKLTELGYKVFFSRITLESKIGEEYEPYIYAALSSSKVMITVCSSSENIQSAWVKNEWSRYLTLRRKDTSKTLIPVYFDMDESGLPEEFALLSAQNMGAEDFEQELIRGIKKLIPTPIILKERRKKTRKTLMIAGLVAIVVGIPLVLLITIPARKQAENEKKYTKAQELYTAGKYEEAQAIYDELGDYEDAAELSVKTSNQAGYEEAQELFASGRYDEAKAIFGRIGGYEDAAELAVKCTYQADYDAAMQLYYDRKYAEATWALQKIGDYPEVQEMLEKCEKKWRESVSTVALTTDFDGGRSPSGSYYINGNGSVDSFGFDKGNNNVELGYDDSGDFVEYPKKGDLDVNSHGKVISIGANYPGLYALYEDGFVCNSAVLNGLDKDWENIIQISDRFNFTNVALKNDGSVIVGEIVKDNVASDEWLNPVKNWRNIIKIDWDEKGVYSSGTLAKAVLVGLDNFGKVHYVDYEINGFTSGDPEEEFYHRLEMEAFLDGLSEIKDIQISRYYIAALDSNDIMHIFNFDDGSISEKENIKDLWSENHTAYVIDSRNNLSKLGSDIKILEGAIYLKDGFCISQSGSIYKSDGTETDGKTAVKDVWLED